MTAQQESSLQAGVVAQTWRKAKVGDFAWRVECLGNSTHPEVLRLLERIASETAAVDAIWDEQRTAPDTTPWWADGDYDEEEADRAAVALQLGQAGIAAADAANAVQRDPGHVRAHLRGGQAAMKLQLPEAALEYFSSALRLSPGLPAAETGAKAAAQLAAQQAEAAQRSAARDGGRASLPDRAPSPEAAAEALLAADAMLAANPNLPAARLAHVEALVLARRFPVALDELCGTRPGADREYLKAEAMWRQGILCTAMSILEAANGTGTAVGDAGGGCSGGSGQTCAGSCKLARLLQQLRSLAALLQSAEVALDDEREQDCVSDCGQLLSAISHCGAAGLEARVLQLRARAGLQLRRLDAAEADVSMAVAAQPGDVGALLLQAEVLGEAGKHQEALLALQAVMEAAPGTPGLLPRLQAAAARAMQCPRRGAQSPAQAAGTAPSNSYHAILCVKPGADSAVVRSAYRRQAARWHPDKWAAAAVDEQQHAAAQYLAVQRAYEVLGG